MMIMLAIVLPLALMASCEEAQSHGTLRISLENDSRSIVPAGYPLETASYRILGSGPSGATLDTMSTLYLSADYSREFMKMFAIGAQFSLYYSSPGILTFPGGATRPKQNTVNYSFGVYFRANMDFLLRWL